MIWCKLTYAAAMLADEDFAGPGTRYPLNCYRAAALLWVTSARRPNEITRLRLGCIRRDWDPRMLAPQHCRKDYFGLRRWLERLPQALLSAYPLLSFASAESLIFTSQRRDPAIRTRIEQPLAIAERDFRGRKDGSRLAQVLSLRATSAFFQHELPTAFALAHETLCLQPEGEHHWRGSRLMLLAIEELLAGRLGSARLKGLEAREGI